jgi:hypothetical protein
VEAPAVAVHEVNQDAHRFSLPYRGEGEALTSHRAGCFQACFKLIGPPRASTYPLPGCHYGAVQTLHTCLCSFSAFSANSLRCFASNVIC